MQNRKHCSLGLLHFYSIQQKVWKVKDFYLLFAAVNVSISKQKLRWIMSFVHTKSSQSDQSRQIFYLQYRPKLIGLLFKPLLWLKYASYRLGNGGIWKSLNCWFRNTPNLLRMLISGLRKLSLKIKGWNLKCAF